MPLVMRLQAKNQPISTNKLWKQLSIKIIFLSRSADQASEDLDNPNFTFDLGRGPHEKVLPVADMASSLYLIMCFYCYIILF